MRGPHHLGTPTHEDRGPIWELHRRPQWQGPRPSQQAPREDRGPTGGSLEGPSGSGRMLTRPFLAHPSHVSWPQTITGYIHISPGTDGLRGHHQTSPSPSSFGPCKPINNVVMSAHPCTLGGPHAGCSRRHPSRGALHMTRGSDPAVLPAAHGWVFRQANFPIWNSRRRCLIMRSCSCSSSGTVGGGGGGGGGDGGGGGTEAGASGRRGG